LARKATGDRVFKTLKPKLMRKRIPMGELAFGAAFLVLLLLTAWWVLAQRDRFDPADRDISFEALQKDSVEDTLYRTPLARWIEPGAAGQAVAAVDLGIFPEGLLDGGWELDGRVEVYDPENLYEKINGAAEQYLAFGFRELHYATLAGTAGFLNVELYDQGDFPSALGIFAAQRDVEREILSDGLLWYYLTPAGAVGGIGKYYFKISGDSADAAITGKARQVAGELARLDIASSRVPRAYTILTDRMGLTLDRVAYQRNDVFQYEFLSDFWFGTVGPDSDARWFLHEAADASRSRELFDRLVEEQLFDYEVLEREPDRVLLEHQYLKTVFAARRKGALLFGVDGAQSADSAREHLRKLEEVTEVEEEAYPTS
jgi:hypothetical protein